MNKNKRRKKKKMKKIYKKLLKSGVINNNIKVDGFKS